MNTRRKCGHCWTYISLQWKKVFDFAGHSACPQKKTKALSAKEKDVGIEIAIRSKPCFGWTVKVGKNPSEPCGKKFKIEKSIRKVNIPTKFCFLLFARTRVNDSINCAKCSGDYSIYQPRCPWCQEWTSFNIFFRDADVYEILKLKWQPYMNVVTRQINFREVWITQIKVCN